MVLFYDREQPPEPVIQRTNKSLAAYQHIRSWFVWPDEDFPRTSTQKPQIGKIQEVASAKFQGTSEETEQCGVLLGLIRQVTGRTIKGASQDSNLSADLDLSSIERVELLSALEYRFQADLNETAFTEATTN